MEAERKLMKAIYPGTFDPITLGHLDVIETASKIFTEVVVAMLVNPKKSPLFSLEARKKMIEAAVQEKGIKNVKVISGEGLTVELAREQEAPVIIRGVRLNTDYESELFLAFNNRVIEPEIETIFIPPKQDHVHISSTAVRELLNLKSKKVEEYLPKKVMEIIKSEVK